VTKRSRQQFLSIVNKSRIVTRDDVWVVDGLLLSSLSTELGDVILGLLSGLRMLRLREDVKVGQSSVLTLGLAGVAPHVGLSAVFELAESADLVVVGSGGAVATNQVVSVGILSTIEHEQCETSRYDNCICSLLFKADM